MPNSEPARVSLERCPNPWCEAEERVGDYRPVVRLSHFGNYRVVCTSCILEGPAAQTQDAAIAAWNRRTSPTSPGWQDYERGLEDAAKIADQWRDENKAAANKARETGRRRHAFDGDETMLVMVDQLDGAAIECNAIATAIRSLKSPAAPEQQP